MRLHCYNIESSKKLESLPNNTKEGNSNLWGKCIHIYKGTTKIPEIQEKIRISSWWWNHWNIIKGPLPRPMCVYIWDFYGRQKGRWTSRDKKKEICAVKGANLVQQAWIVMRYSHRYTQITNELFEQWDRKWTKKQTNIQSLLTDVYFLRMENPTITRSFLLIQNKKKLFRSIMIPWRQLEGERDKFLKWWNYTNHSRLEV